MAVSSTSFKEGNTASVGNKGGRPRHYSKDELIQYLDEFSLKEDAITMGQFSAEYNVCSDYIYNMMDKEPEIVEMYRIAKNRIGIRREKLLHAGAFHVASYNKNQHFFDTHIRKETRDDKKEDIKYAAEVNHALEAQSNTNYTFKVNFGDSKPLSPETIPDQST